MNTVNQMKDYSHFRRIVSGVCALLLAWAIDLPLAAQKDVKQIRKGNDYYKSSEFNQSEIAYRKAMEVNEKSLKARFNLADALYKQGRYDESTQLLSELASGTDDKDLLPGIYHNLGNSYLKQQKVKESIDAYKKSLRLNPADEETRYNLAMAQAMLNQQQNQQNKNQDQKDKDDNKQNPEKNKDQQDQKKDQQDNQDKKDQQNKQDQQQNGKQGLSKEEAARLLQAAMNDEKKARDKLARQQFRSKKVKTDKTW